MSRENTEDDPETSKDDSSITLSDECIAELATKLAEALKVVKVRAIDRRWLSLDVQSDLVLVCAQCQLTEPCWLDHLLFFYPIC